MPFPILLRGYGELPVKIDFGYKVKLLRFMKKFLYKISFKKFNLFTDINLSTGLSESKFINVQESIVIFLERRNNYVYYVIWC